jgi:hypothetical protein
MARRSASLFPPPRYTGAFVIREGRTRAPLLDLALVKDRGIAGANLTLIAVGVPP